MPEVRLYLAGREIVMAFRYAEVPGTNFAQKIGYINSLALDKASTFAEKTGFTSDLRTPGQLLIIPAGHLVLTVTDPKCKEAEFVRWSFSTDPKLKQIHRNHHHLISKTTRGTSSVLWQ